jgi:hypothetical protein
MAGGSGRTVRDLRRANRTAVLQRLYFDGPLTRFLPAVRHHATAYALRHPAEKVTVELGRLGPDAVTVGAAILPLADFFSRGGRRPGPLPSGPAPAWRTALEERVPH